MDPPAVRQREPCAAASSQRLGLRQLLQAEQADEETPRRGLTARRRGELDVVEADDRPAQARFPRPYMNLNTPASSFEVRDL
jgi:hypothetical protein